MANREVNPRSRRAAPAGIEETVLAGTHCRRCRYDLRGLQRSGLCPECGFPIRLSLPSERSRAEQGDRWMPIADGLGGLGHAILWFAPLALGCAAVGSLSAITSIIVAAHGFHHFFSVRSLERGLLDAGLSEGWQSELPVVRRLAVAALLARVHLGFAALGCLLILTGWMTSLLPAHSHLIGVALTLPSAVAAILSAHGVAQALATEIAPSLRREGWWAASLLAITGPTLALLYAWHTWLRLQAMPGAPTTPQEIYSLAALAGLGPAWLVALFLERVLAERLAIAVPQLPKYSAAAARVERGTLPPVRDRRSRPDLPSIPIAPDPRDQAPRRTGEPPRTGEPRGTGDAQA